MAKVKDLGINVIPETMRPQECLPWTIGPVCLPGGITRDAAVAEQAEAPIQITLYTYNGCCGYGTFHHCTYYTTIVYCTLNTLTNCGPTIHCGIITHTICAGGSIVPTTTITPTTPQLQPGTLPKETISALREQLQQHLKTLDEHERKLDDSPKKSGK